MARAGWGEFGAEAGTLAITLTRLCAEPCRIEKPGFVTVEVTKWWAKFQLKAADGETKAFTLGRGGDGRTWLQE